jgi:hypothetical protein
LEDGIPPPVHVDSTLGEIQAEKDDHHTYHSCYSKPKSASMPFSTPQKKALTTIQRCTRHIIKLTPPRKVPLPNQILKHKPNRKPRRVVDPCGRWDVRHAVDNDRHADELDPQVWVLPLPQPEWHWEERAHDDRVQLWVIDRVCAELPQWAIKPPYNQQKRGEGEGRDLPNSRHRKKTPDYADTVRRAIILRPKHHTRTTKHNGAGITAREINTIKHRMASSDECVNTCCIEYCK